MRTKSLINPGGGRSSHLESLEMEGIEMNRLSHVVRIHGRTVHLCYMEFQLHWILLEYKGAIVRLREIKEHLWGDEWKATDGAITSTIARIREKIGSLAGKMIQNIHGIGYRMEGKLPRKISRPAQSVRIDLTANN